MYTLNIWGCFLHNWSMAHWRRGINFKTIQILLTEKIYGSKASSYLYCQKVTPTVPPQHWQTSLNGTKGLVCVCVCVFTVCIYTYIYVKIYIRYTHTHTFTIRILKCSPISLVGDPHITLVSKCFVLLIQLFSLWNIGSRNT